MHYRKIQKSDQIETQTGDPFWEKNRNTFYAEPCLYYMPEEYKDRPLKKNFTTIALDLFDYLHQTTMTEVNLMDFLKFEEKYGEEHIAVKQYKHFKSISQIHQR